jgi:hypothetical protein
LSDKSDALLKIQYCLVADFRHSYRLVHFSKDLLKHPEKGAFVVTNGKVFGKDVKMLERPHKLI